MQNFLEHTFETTDNVTLQIIGGVIKFKRSQKGFSATAEYFPSDSEYNTPAIVLVPKALASEIKDGNYYDVTVHELRSRGRNNKGDDKIKFMVEKINGIFAPLKDAFDDAGVKNLMAFKYGNDPEIFIKKLNKGKVLFENPLTLTTTLPDQFEEVEDIVIVESAELAEYTKLKTKLTELSKEDAVNKIAVALFNDAYPSVKYQNYLTPVKVKEVLEDFFEEDVAKVLTADTSVAMAAKKIQKSFFQHLKESEEK